MTRLVLLAAACAGALALQTVPMTRPVISRTAAGPTMQFGNFFGKKEEEVAPPPAPKGRGGGRSAPKPKGGAFYDDEKDTVSRPDWMPNFSENGGADGVDLATEGAGLYVAFIPFILFFLAYTNGLFSFGYEKGNF